MGWWITLAVLVLLAWLPLGVSIVYSDDGVLINAIAGLIRLKVFPAKKKKKPKKEKAKKPLPEDEAPPAEPEEKPASQPAPDPDVPGEENGGSVFDFLPLVKVGLNFLGDFFGRKLRVNVLELKITLAGGDPCDLALNYGRAWAALGNLWPRLEEFLIIKKRDVNIQCDFEGDKTCVYARLDTTITLGRLLALLCRYGYRALKEFLKIRKKRKGGATA